MPSPDREVAAGPGSYLIKPRGLMHTFWNAGPGPARLLEVIAPAGFETYFAELAEAGDPGRRQELAAKYGVTYRKLAESPHPLGRSSSRQQWEYL
jgi:hypothetical protein